MNDLLSSPENPQKKPRKGIIDSMKKTMLYSLNQKTSEDPKDEVEFISFIKDTIKSVFNTPKHYNDKEEIIDRLKHVLNETMGRNSEDFEEFLKDNKYNEEMIYIQIIRPNKEDILKWEIEKANDIITLIEKEDQLVNTIQSIIHKKHNYKKHKRKTIFKELLKPIEQEFLNTENADDYNEIISNELKKELEYVTIYKLLNLTKQQLQQKRNWCKNALYYIQHKFHYGQIVEPIKFFDKGWEKYYGPIIDEFLQEKVSIHERDHLTINKENSNIDTQPSEHLKLFEKRCKSVLYENPREEHKIGKDLIRELGERKIDLEH